MHQPSAVRVRRGCVRSAALCIVVGAFLAASTGVAYALKVAPTPNPLLVQEGDSHLLTIALDEPIIAPIGGPEPSVIVTFSVDDPSRVSLSAASVTWTASEWFQPRTVTVTALHDGVHDASNTVLVHGVAASESAYYNGFTTSFAVTITDVDPAPTTTTSATTTSTVSIPTTTTTLQPATAVAGPTTISPDRAAQLPATGGEDRVSVVFGALSIISGAALALRRRARVHP